MGWRAGVANNRGGANLRTRSRQKTEFPGYSPSPKDVFNPLASTLPAFLPQAPHKRRNSHTMGECIHSSLGDSLSESQKANLHELADGMLKIYRTLERMRYLHGSWIQPGPHDVSHLVPMYRSHGCDDAIIYLYSILPYIGAPYEYMGFFKGGRFADFRTEEDVKQGRDPFYSDDDNERLLPCMTSLSLLGNHQTVIVYNAKTHWIGMYDQESGGSSDPNIHEWDVPVEEGLVGEEEREGREEEEEDKVGEDDGDDGDGGDEEDEDEDDDEGEGEGEDEDEDEGEGEEDEDEEDESYWYEMDGRAAPNVLRDMVKWYEELSEVPGGADDTPGEWREEISVPVYRKHGWPSADFDGDAFEVDLFRAKAAFEVKETVEEPIDNFRRCEAVIGYHTKRLAEATTRLEFTETIDDAWVARFKLREAKMGLAAAEKDLVEAEKRMENLCPGGKMQNPEDLPLLELRAVETAFWDAQRHPKWVEQRLKELKPEDQHCAPEMKLDLALAQRQAVVAQKALDACRLDAERLCPGRSLPPDGEGQDKNRTLDLTAQMKVKREELSIMVEQLKKDVKGYQDWIADVPAEATEALRIAGTYLESDEMKLKRYTESLEGMATVMEAEQASEQ